MALKLVASVSLLDLGFNEARYLVYQLTDFVEPGLYSENDNPLLVKNLTPCKLPDLSFQSYCYASLFWVKRIFLVKNH